jgi:hypothetical protein
MADANTVKGKLQKIIDDGIPLQGDIQLGDITIDNVGLNTGTNKVGIIDVEQSDKTKLKGTMELSAGSEIVGKVSIDQVTANANEVVVKSIIAGNNLIGKFGIDQTTDGTTNKVNSQNATHDNLNCNANLQVNNADVASGNPIFATLEDGKDITLGAKADNRSTATDTTAISAMSIFKQISYMLQNPASRAVTNTAWDKKEKPFRGTAYFSRPANADAYTALDAITNSTSAPAIMTIDLSSYGVVEGDFIAITNVRVVESTKLSGASVNAWIFPATFTATNDNAEFALTDGEAQTGGVVVPCTNLYTTANNSCMVSDSGLWIMQIASGTSIYVGLQAASGCTFGNNSRIDVFVEGVILK